MVGERGTVVRVRKVARTPFYESEEHKFPGLPRPSHGYQVEADGDTGPVAVVGRGCEHEAGSDRPLDHGDDMERIQGEACIQGDRVRKQGKGVRKNHRAPSTCPVPAQSRCGRGRCAAGATWEPWM